MSSLLLSEKEMFPGKISLTCAWEEILRLSGTPERGVGWKKLLERRGLVGVGAEVLWGMLGAGQLSLERLGVCVGGWGQERGEAAPLVQSFRSGVGGGTFPLVRHPVVFLCALLWRWMYTCNLQPLFSERTLLSR